MGNGEDSYSYDDIVRVNKKIMKTRGTDFEVDDYVLRPIVANLEKRVTTAGRKERALLQAAYLLFMITFRQPFLDGNKTTAFVG